MHRIPTTLAEVIGLWLDNGERRDRAFSVLLDEFLDAFYTETDAARRQAMLDGEPLRTRHERHDAFAGAVAEHLARRWNLRIPAWSEAPWRELAEPWFVGMMGKGLSGLLLVESPIAFRRRRIFTEAEPLRRARMPVG